MPLVEVLGTSRSHATPGWAYVPETALQKSSSAVTTSRKRGIREPGRSGGGADLTSRQNHAIIRHLAELDRENHRDNVHIPVPARKDAIQRDNGKGARAKTTSNVRRILQSQKTFKNYLDDEEAALAHSTTTGVTAAGVIPAASAGVSKVARVAARRSLTPAAATTAATQDTLTERQKRALARKTTSDATAEKPATKKPKPEQTRTTENVQEEEMDVDTPQPIQKGLLKTTHDNDHLLKSYIPLPPSDRLMAALLAEPPLRYHAARAAPPATHKPARRFCTICGYWGKIKCKNCGVRTCGLECYKVHEDSRCGAFF